MRILDVKIRRFRNLDAVDWSPAPGLNLIWGGNGQGKTNILEAIHVALTGRSFRTRRDDELIPWRSLAKEGDETLCEARIAKNAGERVLRVMIGPKWKRAFADGRWIARLGDMVAEAPVVVFTPEDADLFKGPPAGRRRLLDTVLSQVSGEYLDRLQRYAYAMRQLAAGYRSPGQRRDAASFAPAAAAAGSKLLLMRHAILTAARGPLAARFAALGGTGRLELKYEPSLKGLAPAVLAEAAARPEDTALFARVKAHYMNVLEGAWKGDARKAMDVTGAHRDDFSVTLEGQDLRRFGSQGQQRLAALAIKLECARWIEEARGERPLLLLDDFGSELDCDRRRAVLADLRRSMQVIVTATDKNDIFAGGNLFDEAVEAGELMGRKA